MKTFMKIKNLVFALVLLFLFTESKTITIGANELSVAEKNALMGFNDTIDRLAPDFVTVSLCVADPTDQRQDYLGITGHAFLRLQCPTFGLDYCCSYESETIKGQVWDYLRGELEMGMFAVPTDEYLEDYRIWQRAVHEYKLNLPEEAELRLWELMDSNVSAGEMQLDIVKFGCSNTVLRYVEKALQPETIVYNWPEKFHTKDIMDIVSEHFANYPWTLLGVRLTASQQLKRLRTPKQKVIFPDDLVEVWSNALIKDQPMMEYIGDLVEAEPVIVPKPWFTPQLCGILLLAIIAGGIILAVIRKHKITNHQ